MRIIQTSTLAAPKEVVVKLLQRSHTLRWVAKGFVTYEGTLPNRWVKDESVELSPRLFGILPPSSHQVKFVEIDPEQGYFQTREVGKPFSQWDHTMLIEAVDNSHCIYTDIIECDAGILNPIAGQFVKSFYKHRHQRWHKLLSRVRVSA